LDGDAGNARSEQVDAPDAADVLAAASGDVDAFARLVRATQGPVWRYLVHLVGDGARAEDLSQEVYLRAYRKLHTLEDPHRFLAWIMVSARNAAYDDARRRKRRPLELVGDRDVTSSQAGHDPHLTFEVHDALARLDETLRESLVLVGMIGLSYQEAADAIGVPEGTVKSRTFRARKLLTEMLAVGEDDV
jgi:RNA polymerase sigma-70 factor (ECF subfamily)